jgi:hypothetical protein
MRREEGLSNFGKAPKTEHSNREAASNEKKVPKALGKSVDYYSTTCLLTAACKKHL